MASHQQEHSSNLTKASSQNGTILSRKDRRKLKQGKPEPTPIEVQEPIDISSDEESAEENLETYTCYICLVDYPADEGIIPCMCHFICKECAERAMVVSLKDMSMYPAKCCVPIPRSLARDLVNKDVYQKYTAKAEEGFSNPTRRLYCSNPECATFLSRNGIDNSDWRYSVAHCCCGTDTCAGCGGRWTEEHLCETNEDPRMKPDWMPQYTQDCRIKMCPGTNCHLWIEHKEACNHMQCTRCEHQFCFICLQEWNDQHLFTYGCPQYGDPPEGYDEEGYERSRRGLHRDDGYDRNGYNVWGVDKFGQSNPNPDSADEGFMVRDDSGQDEEFEDEEAEEEIQDAHWEEADQGDDEWFIEPDGGGWDIELDGDEWDIEPHGDEGRFDEDPVDEIPVGADWVTINDDNEDGERTERIDGSTHHEHESSSINEQPSREDRPLSRRERKRLRRITDFYSPPLSFYTLNYCKHDWLHTYSAYGVGYCNICFFSLHYYGKNCTKCGTLVCTYCRDDFSSRSQVYCSEADLDMVAVFRWAEGEEIPFHKQIRQGIREMELPDTDWCIGRMFSVAEEALFYVQPFLYHDYGIFELFEEAELEAQKEYWIIPERDVGVIGPADDHAFRLDTNPFAPLFWDSPRASPPCDCSYPCREDIDFESMEISWWFPRLAGTSDNFMKFFLGKC